MVPEPSVRETCRIAGRRERVSLLTDRQSPVSRCSLERALYPPPTC
ncbi:hypothetical protein HMPREF9141_1184 [Prevotella multiformis DSM 16608]|uniref:Uncharacterized protein n=1 Tax=Prevotella multiformis DSM 16608 TaxID=888743 RepID=F0F6G2_9BACT|nr:hypothetical protein HMPREF9141_1184 [Prevotella multiformis DSM 16608]